MKNILILGAASLAFLCSSCMTVVPVNPNTGDPSCCMMPCKHCPHHVVSKSDCALKCGRATSCDTGVSATK